MPLSPVITRRTGVLKRLDLELDGKSVDGSDIKEKLVLLCKRGQTDQHPTVEEIEFRTSGDKRLFEYFRVLNDRVVFSDCEVAEQQFYDPVKKVFVPGEPTIQSIRSVELLVEKMRDRIDLNVADEDTLGKISKIKSSRLKSELEQAKLERAEERIKSLTEQIQQHDVLQESLKKKKAEKILGVTDEEIALREQLRRDKEAFEARKMESEKKQKELAAEMERLKEEETVYAKKQESIKHRLGKIVTE